MVKLHSDYRVLDHMFINRVYENNPDKVIAITRGDLLCVFNFNPSVSFTDYGIPLKGKFKLILDSDDPAFGGFDRIDRKTIYTSLRKTEGRLVNAPFYLYLYLPARTALIFRKETIRKATDI
jgi:1,4-alpha-glucan branching enzyme